MHETDGHIIEAAALRTDEGHNLGGEKEEDDGQNHAVDERSQESHGEHAVRLPRVAPA